MILNKIKGYSKSQFGRNFLTLVSGTTIAQLIPVIASPVLTRLYSPVEFGIFANFLSLSAILMVFYSGKFEFAIILPARNEAAINVLSLSIIFSVFSTLFFGIVFMLFSSFLNSKILYLSKISSLLWLVPFSALLSNLFFILNEWYIRKRDFFNLSKNKITNTSAVTLSSLINAFVNIANGLVIGQLMGQAIAVFFAMFRFLKQDRWLLKNVSLNKIKYSAKRYISFLKYYMPGQLINTFTGQLPVFFFTSYFGIFQVGLFSLTDRVLGVSMSFISTAIRDVYKQKAAIEYRENGSCRNTFKKISLMLVAIGLIPFLLLVTFAPALFSLAFGSQWHESGIIARFYCISTFLSFISVPLSYTLIIAEKQHYDFIWQILFFALIVSSLIIAANAKDFMLAIILLTMGRSVAYIFQYMLSYKFTAKIDF